MPKVSSGKRKTNHESTKDRKHEGKPESALFRVFDRSCFASLCRRLAGASYAVPTNDPIASERRNRSRYTAIIVAVAGAAQLSRVIDEECHVALEVERTGDEIAVSQQNRSAGLARIMRVIISRPVAATAYYRRSFGSSAVGTSDYTRLEAVTGE